MLSVMGMFVGGTQGRVGEKDVQNILVAMAMMVSIARFLLLQRSLAQEEQRVGVVLFLRNARRRSCTCYIPT